MFYMHPNGTVFEIHGSAKSEPEVAVRDVLLDQGYDDETVELAVLSITEAPDPCGYCRRCLLHDDPCRCLVVAEWERDHPEMAAASWVW